MNEETQKQEQPGLQGSHPSEALNQRVARWPQDAHLIEECGIITVAASELNKPVSFATRASDAEDWDLGPPYCGTDGTCESCQ